MSAWTLRGGHPNHQERPTSPAERRALRQVRRHANETGPLDMAVPSAPAVGYQPGELFGGFRAALAGIAPVAGVGPGPVAVQRYRETRHGRGKDVLT